MKLTRFCVPVFFLLCGFFLVPYAQAGDDAAVSNIFVNLAKKMVPSVVNIFTTSSVKAPWRGQGDPGNDLWRRFFDEYFGGTDPFGGGAPERGMPGGRVQSLGTGFVIEETEDGGLILTNNHVIDEADEVKIKFTESTDEKASAAEIVGRDADLDVALLRVKTKRKLVAAVLGDSDKLEQGEWVMAVGNPFGHGHSVAKGIVSAKERTLPGSYSQYLQVDAPINPGNSGGPLANLQGEVVGINNAVLANAQGIGFAIPINLVKKILPQLKTKGHVERGYIGINIEDLRPTIAKNFKVDENLRAPIVTNVIKGGPADKAGLKAYDVITEIEGKQVKDTLDLVNTITNMSPGEKAQIKFQRQGKEKTVSVLVAKRPTDPTAHGRAQGKKEAKPKQQVETGLSVETLDDELRKELGINDGITGVVVAQVSYGSPADRAGLQRGDVILEVDRKPLKTTDGFYALVKEHKTYLLRVRRQNEQGEESYAVVTLNLSSIPDPEEE